MRRLMLLILITLLSQCTALKSRQYRGKWCDLENQRTLDIRKDGFGLYSLNGVGFMINTDVKSDTLRWEHVNNHYFKLTIDSNWVHLKEIKNDTMYTTICEGGVIKNVEFIRDNGDCK